ncbi:MAG: low-specificity L-threonine aldolase [Betaproteobacteria bacterium]|jgi:threonine aldolase|nr:low-specificity L-threonine aldolase [Rhodocyclaceae bacterium]MCA3133390.1 low-specificity L-threonine aldolase [Rhodocyclaceae bacterium]MCA3143267.1 low-specificity L-threonine aldolase [Rhodocyclaceae bacterium]MCA3144603.1 low-specificity L-threonine aldolase [Rhodocyclaceae bacterium]MCE2896366.1 low-specificity L-threonine aldolase [Betaproteobacteria bacterium]
MKPIDLRSDTVTLPSEAMRAAMARAEVGDDVYGEDPTVNRLEALVAEQLGKEAALYVATGTQSNLIGLMSHCERGDEYIVGQQAHTYKYEGGGAAVLGSIQPQPLENEPDGSLDLERVAAAIKPNDPHFARTRLLALENTIGGKVLPLDYLAQAEALARSRGLAMHLDGARLFNAVVKLGVPASRIARHFDTVSVCLSKGLGAPVGSVLVGPAALMERARRWRKVLGGGMRQAGLMAAAGIHALEHNVQRLADDHANARALAEALQGIPGLRVDPAAVQTNMVFMHLAPEQAEALRHWLAERGMRINAGAVVRLVTHLDVDAAGVAAFADAVRAFFEHAPQGAGRAAALA